jgi:hypothetical protein
MRQGQTDRTISRDRVLGRRKTAALRQAAAEQGWLEDGAQMPTPAQIVGLVACSVEDGGGMRSGVPVSSVAPYADRIKAWFDEGVRGVAIHAALVRGVAIHAALVRDHGFTGHYSSVRRHLNKLKGSRVGATIVLDFAPPSPPRAAGARRF